MVEGGAVHGPSESASQNKNSSTTTTKKTPSKASRQIKAQPHCEAGTVTNSPTTSQRSPKVKKVPERRSQLIIENFFKQQRLSIENGENPVARMQLKVMQYSIFQTSYSISKPLKDPICGNFRKGQRDFEHYLKLKFMLSRYNKSTIYSLDLLIKSQNYK